MQARRCLLEADGGFCVDCQSAICIARSPGLGNELRTWDGCWGRGAELWSGSQEGDVAPPTPRSAPQYLLCANENHKWSRYRPTTGLGQSLPSSTGTQTRAADPHREVRERKRVLCLGRKEGAPGRYKCPSCFFLLGSGRRLPTL